MSIRILIVEDHHLVREGLCALLSSAPEMEIVAQTGLGLEAVELAEQLSPDVILLDFSLPDVNGLEVLKLVKERGIQSRVLILTVQEEGALLRDTLRSGASGYIIKRAVAAELTRAISIINDGDLYVHPAMIRYLVEYQSEGEIDAMRKKSQATALTKREREVLALIAQGYTNLEAGEILMLSARTVEKHRANSLHKLQIHTRAEILQYIKDHPEPV
jgi:two-component system, NarL family, response regulator DegU